MIHVAVNLVLFTYFYALQRCGCTHIFSLERDFGRVTKDQGLAGDVSEILSKIKTFKVPVHPRLKLFYRLLQKGVRRYTYRTEDRLYWPHKYQGQ